MIAILIFLILNFSLFIPRYYLNKNNSSFFPFKEIFENKRLNINKLINRFNDDVFRINFEFSLLIIVVILLKNFIFIEFIEVFVSVFYFFTLVLFFYHYSILSIYKSYPTLYSDWKLIKQGFQIAKSGYLFQLIIGSVFFLLISVILVYLNIVLINELYTNESLVLLIFCSFIIAITFIFSVIKKVTLFVFDKEFDFHYMSYLTIQVSVLHIKSNRFFSKKTKEEIIRLPEIISKNIITIPKDLELKSKPNIYFIAIESYGAILYENEVYRKKYISLLRNITTKLNSKNWKIASSLSKSPVSGGGSWMSYSSFLKGININSDLMYRKLLNERNDFPTQSLFSVLEELGYSTNLIAAVGGYENFKIEWNEILEFLGTKNVIRYKDLEYKGETFNFGPSAPDQFMLNKSIELLKGKNLNQPFTFFVETINSHADFETPTKLFDDWNKCKTATRKDFNPSKDFNKNLIDNYFLAIEYQLKTIEDLILNEKEDSIFVVFGDHQPPLITTNENSFETPIHIISRNNDFINCWIEKGFSPSLEIKNQNCELNHYDMKTIFFDSFMESFKKK